MLLSGKTLAQQTKSILIEQKKQYFWDRKVYVAIVFLWENNPSQVYVNSKIRYAQELWIECTLFGQDRNNISKEELFSLIYQLNEDQDCIGIIVQLPLPDHLQAEKDTICAAVHPLKDIDGLGWILCWWNQLGLVSFQPATAKAVLDLRDFYALGAMKGLRIHVIGQSNVVWKPLAIECLKRWAIVQTFTDVDSRADIANSCQNADVIISATGVIHLVDTSFINSNKEQIIIDVGYGFLEGKAVGDVKFDEVSLFVKAISPVPGGIWPLTVASLFSNIFVLQEQKEIIETLWKNLVW